MTPVRRRRFFFICARIVVLTGMIVFIDWNDGLDRIEHLLSDVRLSWFQPLQPPPSDQIVHLDIDEDSLSQIGHWPWQRETMASIIDEIALADPKVLVMDILFAEPEKPGFERDGKLIDHDAALAESLRKFG